MKKKKNKMPSGKYCPYCKRNHEVEKTIEIARPMINGKSVLLVNDALMCKKTNKTFFTLEQLQDAIKNLYQKRLEVEENEKKKEKKGSVNLAKK